MTFGEQARALLGTWGRPPDDPAKAALGAAVVLLLLVISGRARSLLGLGEHPLSRRLFLWIASFAAALLSIAYVATYLHGGPRIIDATTYFLQGRALSHGDLAWTPLEPSASFRGRFLLFEDGRLGGIFPPGYPLLLAIGFKLGAPMVVGPALAVLIVLATYRLARILAEELVGSHADCEPIARGAALVSIACGALRYHTADTMAHGATALGIALVLVAALRGRAGWAGLALGAVIATRPVSAVAIALVAGVVLVQAHGARSLLRVAFGALPGVLLLVVAQHTVTGHWLSSSQKMYYALADGPPGCFRWGFGDGTGCLFEHGDFVEAHLQNGYGVAQAAGTTLRRLKMHVLDVANLEPLALLVLVPLLPGRRSRGALAALSVILLHVLAYAGFYFDGNYPGGGARIFADVLPLEHALLALGVLRLAGLARFPRAVYALVALMLAGFGVHAVFGHLQLAEREGGRPMYEPDVLTKANITSGLVFVDTDHGFALGYDPFASTHVKSRVLVARFRNDDRERLLYDRLDHPPTFFYRYDPAAAPAAPGAAPPTITPWAPPALGDPARFEAEAEWPPLAETGGYAIPAAADACASLGRVLALTPVPLAGKATATIAVPVPASGKYRVTVRAAQNVKIPHTTSRIPGKPPKASATVAGETWEWSDLENGAACAELAPRDLTLTAPAATLTLTAQGGTIALDRVTLKPLP